jgi:putative ABC transport system substrate-binding protein
MTKNGYEEVLYGFKEAIYLEGMVDEVDLIIQNSGVTKNDFIEISKNISNSDIDVILTVTTPVTLAVYEHVKNKPIVFAAVGDPVSAGLAKDFKNPNKNITVVTNLSRMLTKKRMEVFKMLFQ